MWEQIYFVLIEKVWTEEWMAAATCCVGGEELVTSETIFVLSYAGVGGVLDNLTDISSPASTCLTEISLSLASATYLVNTTYSLLG